MSEIINGIINSGAISDLMKLLIIALLFILYDRKKSKSTLNPIENIGPIIETAVNNLGIKYIKAKIDKEQIDATERVDRHSEGIKTLEKESKACMQGIDKRVRETERKISSIETDVKNVKSSITDINQSVRDGNDNLIEVITNLLRKK